MDKYSKLIRELEENLKLEEKEQASVQEKLEKEHSTENEIAAQKKRVEEEQSKLKTEKYDFLKLPQRYLELGAEAGINILFEVTIAFGLVNTPGANLIFIISAILLANCYLGYRLLNILPNMIKGIKASRKARRKYKTVEEIEALHQAKKEELELLETKEEETTVKIGFLENTAKDLAIKVDTVKKKLSLAKDKFINAFQILSEDRRTSRELTYHLNLMFDQESFEVSGDLPAKRVRESGKA